MSDGYGPWAAPEDGEPASFHAPPPMPPTPPSRRMGAGAAALLVAAGALGGALVTHVTRGLSPRPPALGSGRDQGTSSGTGPADAASIAARVNAGVVDINTNVGYQDAQAAGTGMVLTADGVVLTNNHVISGATRISVTDVGNGRTYQATVLGYDRTHDVAVLRLTGATRLRTVSLGASSKVHVGQAVVGVGNAGGAGGTPSYAGGTVTALDQSITATDEGNGTTERLTGLIETDAGIVAGDSGGPLVDQQGKVIGMDTAATAGFRFRSAAGPGYAIPIDAALQIARLIEAGRSSATVHVGPTALLGVEVQSGGDSFGLRSGSGAVVADVLPGGPADAAGMGSGDVITAVGGHTVTDPETLTRAMLLERPGATVRVDYVDAFGQPRSATVHLTSGPPQ